MKVDPNAEREQIERLNAFKAQRNQAEVNAALANLAAVARTGENIMPASIRCAHAGVTTGEWSQVLREVFGEYRPPTGIDISLQEESPSAIVKLVRERVRSTGEELGRPLRILVGKPGLDGHSNGAEQIAVKARDVGFEIVYEGIRLTPQQIAKAALEEGVHLIGLSVLSGSHLELADEIFKELGKAGLADIPVIVGGIIPRGRRAGLALPGRGRRLYAQEHRHEHHHARSGRHHPSVQRPETVRTEGGLMLARNALPDPEALAAAVTARDRAALARSLNLLDDKRPQARRCAAHFLATLPSDRLNTAGHLIGITGPPGAGKSSLTSALIEVWRRRRLAVGILAVDPSSPLSGGALLGDRLRMLAHDQGDGNVFIRSLACRGEFGGLSAEVWPMSLAMLAAFDIVLIETVGVGQKEIDISKMSDTTCFVAQPASGDSIQFLKAGIMEVPHILVVNKEDIGAAARKTLTELRTTLKKQIDPDGWQVPALSVSATTGSGIEKLADVIDQPPPLAGRAPAADHAAQALSGGMDSQAPAGGIRPFRHRATGWGTPVVRVPDAAPGFPVRSLRFPPRPVSRELETHNLIKPTLTWS